MVLAMESNVLSDGDVLKLTIGVRPTGDAIHAKKLYLTVKALECSSTKNVQFEEEFIVVENIQVNAGEEGEWAFEVQLPPEVPATHIGKHFSLEWAVRAGLDMSGVDPHSGWERFVLNKEMDYSINKP